MLPMEVSMSTTGFWARPVACTTVKPATASAAGRRKRFTGVLLAGLRASRGASAPGEGLANRPAPGKARVRRGRLRYTDGRPPTSPQEGRFPARDRVKLSVIIPAYNEEKLLPGCLAHVRAALAANAAADWASEVIVADNNSTDRTAELARAAGARVVFEPVNQISRARNAGARVASGDLFLFVDADSTLHPATVADLLRCLRR